MEWARRLSADDVKVLRGEAPYSERVPDPDEGFSQADLKNQQRAQAIYKVIRARLAKAQQERPIGYLVRMCRRTTCAVCSSSRVICRRDCSSPSSARSSRATR